MLWKQTAFRLLMAAVTALFLCCPAIAETLPAPETVQGELVQPLLIQVSISPEALVTPQETAISFTITNASAARIDNITLTAPDGQQSESLGALSPDETQTFTRAHAVTQEQLDSGAVSYVISGDTDTGRVSYPAIAYVHKAAPQPQVEFSRQISSTSVAEGHTVVIVYRVQNTGNVAVTSLNLSDPLGDFTARAENLGVGEYRTFTNRVRIEADSVSSPQLEYICGEEAQNTYTSRLGDAAIRISHSGVDAVLTAGRSIFKSDSAEVFLQLTNTGDVAYSDVTIFDDVYGGVIADSLTLPVGNTPLEISHTYPLRGDGSFRWRITGRSEAGDRIDFLTDTVSVFSDETDDTILLTIRAETSMPQINRKGYVPFTIEITNIGARTASRAVLFEETLGEICELAVVPTGDPTRYTVRCEVSEDSSYVFSVRYADAFGVLHTATADPVEVTIAAGGQTPERDSSGSSEFDGIAVQMGNSSLFMIMLLSCCGVLIVLCVILFITSRRSRRARKQRIAERKQRIREEMARTSRFTPIKKTPPANKK